MYPACISSGCTLREKCLRSIAWHHRDRSKAVSALLEPGMTSDEGKCRYFRSAEPQRFAVGFKNFKRRMYPAQYEQFTAECISHFGRSSYYLRRSGKFALPPAEQEYIRSVLEKVGAKADMDFDAWEERYDWGAAEEL